MPKGNKTTRSAEKEAEMRRISQVGDFKSRLGGIQELPSGLMVLVRNPGGMQAFLGSGIIPNSLMPIVKEAIQSGKGVKAEELMPDGEISPELLRDMQTMTDNVVLATVKKPKLHPVPTEADLSVWNNNHPDDQLEDVEDLRDDYTLYIDELPMDDKQFIFQWVTGGTRDLATFREKFQQRMDDVSTVSRAAGLALLADGADEG